MLPGCDRHQAVSHAYEAIREVDHSLQQHSVGDDALRCVVIAGVASVTLPPKNFPPLDLVDAAQRCLAAAQSGGASVVKSLEVF